MLRKLQEKGYNRDPGGDGFLRLEGDPKAESLPIMIGL